MADIVNNVSWCHRSPAGTLELGRKLHPPDNPPREPGRPPVHRARPQREGPM